MMITALYERPGRLSVVEKNIPGLQPDEALVKVDACGVCGTDLHIVEGKSRSTPPVVPGHEFNGTISDIRSDNGMFSSGQRVAVDPNIPCDTCYYCRRGLVHLCENLKALGVDIDGGMAEYCVVPVRQLYRLPDTITQEQAVFIEPLSCIIHGIDRANVSVGDTAVIIGGGTVGLLMLALLKKSGVSGVFLIEPVAFKRDIARKLGADAVLDPLTENVREAILDMTGVGADVVFECAGTTDTARQSFEYVRRGGTVEFFGVCPIGETIQVEPNSVFVNELTIVGSYINPNTFSRAVQVLSSGMIDIDKLLIREYTLENIHAAFESLRAGDTIKSIVCPGE